MNKKIDLETEVSLCEYSLPLKTIMYLETSAMLHSEDVESHFHRVVSEGLHQLTPLDENGAVL